MGIKKSEYMNVFYAWLDANYGDAHPHRQFMKMAWQAGVRYATAASQQAVEANAESRCECPHPDNWDCEYHDDGVCGCDRTA